VQCVGSGLSNNVDKAAGSTSYLCGIRADTSVLKFVVVDLPETLRNKQSVEEPLFHCSPLRGEDPNGRAYASSNPLRFHDQLS
jgi:hypothetical protein